MRKKGHGGLHTPDLTGMTVGRYFIVGVGPQYKNNKNKNKLTRWVVEVDGERKLIFASGITSGDITGTSFANGYASGGRNNGHPEYSTVSTHHYYIFIGTGLRYRSYKGMPFCEEWNPDKGGAFWKGAKWIIDNLGKRPDPEWSMDIIKHELGFVPGNLRWASKKVQRENKSHRTLGQWGDEEFAVEAKRRGYVKINQTEAA